MALATTVAFAPPHSAEQPHAAIIARDQRAFGRRHRHVEVAVGVLALDQERAGEPDRHLGRADEILDVAGQGARIEGMPADVVEPRAGSLLDEGAPLGRGLDGVVVRRDGAECGAQDRTGRWTMRRSSHAAAR